MILVALELVLFLCLNKSYVGAVLDKLGNDLASFVTRPELRPPRFNVTTYFPQRVTPGYWFYTPYDTLTIVSTPRSYYPTQTGPHIFDQQGNLVWSGGFEYGNGSVSDFKVVTVNGQPHLSFIDVPRVGTGGIYEGEGIILDQTYSVKGRVRVTGGDEGFNMHEFQVINDGKTALAQTGARKLVDYTDFAFDLGPGSGYIGDATFLEIDVATGKQIFKWESSKHVSLNASYITPSSFTSAWDFFHMNSVDKNAEGDYLISSRFTSCIYKVSGKDGTVLWRLGGKESDFILNGFNFSSQHHARFHEEVDTTTVISFLNNASDMENTNHSQTANWSSAFFVELDTSTMVARLLRSYDRPDHKLTRLRGAVQTLPDGNVFVSWSENGYHSEFTVDGELVQEAKFSSTRLVDYRAYKFSFTAYPNEPPVLKAFAYGANNLTITTVIYVSWNGATEIRDWRFYQASRAAGLDRLLLGTATKSGFETMFVAAGYVRWVYAEAIAANGQILGQTTVEQTITEPQFWTDSSEITSEPAPVISPLDAYQEETYIPEQEFDVVPPEFGRVITPSSCGLLRDEMKFSLWVVLLFAIISSALLAGALRIYSTSRERRRRIGHLCSSLHSEPQT